MLKCSVRPLITLVLALVMTGGFATLSAARELRSPVGPPTAHATASVKAGPITTLGEPDQPCSPPPVHSTSEIARQDAGDPHGYGVWLFWSTSWIWEKWLSRAAL